MALTSSYLFEELCEFLPLSGLSTERNTAFPEGLPEEIRDVPTNRAQFAGLDILRFLVLVGAWKQVGEEFQRNGQEKFAGGNDDKDRERNQSSQVPDCSLKLHANVRTDFQKR